jgi:hypothetical protein
LEGYEMTAQKFVGIAVAILVCSAVSSVQATNIYFNNFDGPAIVRPGVTAVVSGPTTLESVQGWVGLGTGSNTFDGNFLGNQASGNPAAATVLTIANLPAHNFVSVDFLLALVDSWDGAEGNVAAPDFLLVQVDGATILRETFANDGRPQSYVAPPTVELARNVQLGYIGGEFVDGAYNMGRDGRFNLIPHTSSSLVVSWRAFGAGYEGGPTEWFALDNLRIATFTTVPEPSALVLEGLGMLLIAGACIRRRRV